MRDEEGKRKKEGRKGGGRRKGREYREPGDGGKLEREDCNGVSLHNLRRPSPRRDGESARSY